VDSADNEMKALDHLDSKNVAVVNDFEFGSLFKADPKSFVKDSSAIIKLDVYKPNYLKYSATNSHEGVAVFSEVYYKNGWNAYIDGNKTDVFQADYVLRALKIPSGKHIVEFKFEPQVVQTGSIISLISSVCILLLLVAGIYFKQKKKISKSDVR
jgi:uncharacterized membrane protein YfhO